MKKRAQNNYRIYEPHLYKKNSRESIFRNLTLLRQRGKTAVNR